LIPLLIPVSPPFLKIPVAPLNDLGLPEKEYYTTGDICKLLRVKPDTLRARIRAGRFADGSKVGGKRRFTKKQLTMALNGWL
jgi:excisionase family DNA binding protein